MDLLGHSYGGLLALEATLRTVHVRRLLVYEGVPTPEHRVADHVIDRREVRAFERTVFDPDRFRDHRVPTVLLVGGDSPTWVRRGAESVGRDLPGGRVVELAGAEHVGMYTAPEAFVEVVVAAFDRS